MSEVFSDKKLRVTLENLLKEKKCKETEEHYLACIDMLESILSADTIKSQILREEVHFAILSFRKHCDLGIILNGAFVPLESHLAARHGIELGNLISGKRFPVVQRGYAESVLLEPLTSELPTDCIWDIDTGTILHIRAHYFRHPEELWSIKTPEIIRLRLTELFRKHCR